MRTKCNIANANEGLTSTIVFLYCKCSYSLKVVYVQYTEYEYENGFVMHNVFHLMHF